MNDFVRGMSWGAWAMIRLWARYKRDQYALVFHMATIAQSEMAQGDLPKPDEYEHFQGYPSRPVSADERWAAATKRWDEKA